MRRRLGGYGCWRGMPASASWLLGCGRRGAAPAWAASFASRRAFTTATNSFPFRVDQSFVGDYKSRTAPFGFNGLGELVYLRTYARLKEDGSRERWWETVERVVNGTFSMQKRWMDGNCLGWDEAAAQRSAQDMYSRIFQMKFLPPGRGLWAMGSVITEERRLFAALNNCAFVSTHDLAADPAAPFCFLMDASMLGVGVGFDTEGAGAITVKTPPGAVGHSGGGGTGGEVHIVADSREGFVAALRELLLAYLVGDRPAPTFDFSRVRPAGSPIRGFGGTSSGPAPLQQLLAEAGALLDGQQGKPVSVTLIVDLMNLIGRCVVSGNVRRTAEIAFGDPDLEEYVDLKDYTKNPHREGFGWTSNNSVLAQLGMNYAPVCERVAMNGEPGFAWLENMRRYGRMNGRDDGAADARAMGGNPCLEQTLESYEMCCLVETFPHRNDDLDDYIATLDSAHLYAKTVTLGSTHWPETNRVLLRNRRIGCSMSGIAQFIAARGLDTLGEWANCGYDRLRARDAEVSEMFAVPQSIKLTSIKPSGTVSLLAGATAGVHYPEATHYIRRIRIARNATHLVAPLAEAGYPLEPAATDPENTVVVEIPVFAGEKLRTAADVSLWEQMSLAAFLQRHWADNQVSCTVTFDPATEASQLPRALDFFQYQLKGISFLPRLPHGAFEQMPYEAITADEYHERVRHLSAPDFSAAAVTIAPEHQVEAPADLFCDACEQQGNSPL